MSWSPQGMPFKISMLENSAKGHLRHWCWLYNPKLCYLLLYVCSSIQTGISFPISLPISFGRHLYFHTHMFWASHWGHFTIGNLGPLSSWLGHYLQKHWHLSTIFPALNQHQHFLFNHPPLLYFQWMLELTFSAQCNFFKQLTVESSFFPLGCQSSPKEGWEARAIDRAPHSELALWVWGVCDD